MKQLVKVIGLAPSEMSFAEFFDKLMKERQRVVRSLQAFRAEPLTMKKKRAPKVVKERTTQKVKADLMVALEGKAAELGISVEELMAKFGN